MFKYLISLILITVFLTSCTQEPARVVLHNTTSQAKSASANNNPYKFVINKGDTLYSIAKKNNVEIRQVIEENHLRPPYILIPGQSIKLPEARFHIVAENDTLYAISRSYGVDIGRLANKNNLTSPYNLAKGQKLWLPSATTDIGTEKYDFSTKETATVSHDVNFTDLAPIDTSTQKKEEKNSNSMDEEDNPFTTKNYNTESSLEDQAAKSQVTKDKDKNKNSDKPLVSGAFKNQTEKEFATNYNEKSKPANNTTSINKTNNIKNEELSSVSPSSKSSNIKTSSLAKSDEEEDLSIHSVKKSSANSSSKSPIFVWPLSGKTVSGFGPKRGGLYNDGINISAKEGSPIKAAEDGDVIYSGNELRGYGNMLLLKHNNGYLTSYAHADNIIVKKGDVVKKGQVIGYVGKTGHVSSPQLHFSIRQGRKAINPEKLLPENS